MNILTEITMQAALTQKTQRVKDIAEHLLMVLDNYEIKKRGPEWYGSISDVSNNLRWAVESWQAELQYYSKIIRSGCDESRSISSGTRT